MVFLSLRRETFSSFFAEDLGMLMVMWWDRWVDDFLLSNFPSVLRVFFCLVPGCLNLDWISV